MCPTEGKREVDKIFKLTENGTSVKTEVIAGLTTFMTMAYIIALNPNILANYGFTDGGMNLWNAVFLATCIASGIAMMCMAFIANKPFCLAPGMGLNSFFAVVVGNVAAITGMTYVASFQSALIIILVEGIVFVILTLCNIREKIVDAIPLGVRLGIAPAIGMMLLNIGLGSNVYIADSEQNQFFVMKDFFGSLTATHASEMMTDAYPVMVLSVITMFIGLFIIVVLAKQGVKANVIIGMLVASIIYWIGDAVFLGGSPFASLATASWVPAFSDLTDLTLFKLNFSGFLQIGWFTAITLIITFCMIDMFDTIGTLVGTASRAGMVDDKGKMPGMKQALLADSIGTVTGSLTGTSTVTTFVESASGVEAGGRTGLTAFTCGVMFLLCIFIAPLAAVIPAAATSSALIYVGVLMLSGLEKVDWGDLDVVVPVTLMLIAMPISGSIGHAIGIAMIAYTVIKVCSAQAREVSALTYVIAGLFLIKFFLVV